MGELADRLRADPAMRRNALEARAASEVPMPPEVVYDDGAGTRVERAGGGALYLLLVHDVQRGAMHVLGERVPRVEGTWPIQALIAAGEDAL